MTKAEERKILEQIVDLIQSTPMDSYIRSAFSGVPEYAVRNIDDDAAYNPVEERDMWEKRCYDKDCELQKLRAEFEQAKQDNREYRASTNKVLDDMTEELTMWKNKHTDSVEHYEKIIAENNGKIAELRRDIAGCEECNKELRDQIIHLKAEIYDWERA